MISRKVFNIVEGDSCGHIFILQNTMRKYAIVPDFRLLLRKNDKMLKLLLLFYFENKIKVYNLFF